MKYQSTRGEDQDLSFEEVLLNGYASDGGMFLPMTIPKISEATLEEWSSLGYIQIVKKICSLFIEDEMTSQEINDVVDAAYKTFSDPEEPIKTRSISADITLLEMFHGKSKAFKDLSMSCAAQFMQHFLQKRNSRITHLIATSGDTGSSALEAIAGAPNMDIVVLLPKDRISKVQELQMTTVVGDNCHVIRANGTSDDCDIPLRQMFCDKEFSKKHCLGSLNSVNWCRTMVQIAHHFYSYFQGRANGCVEKKVVFYIPTGGMGNSAAGCIARMMGLPIQMVCAVTNDALIRLVKDGVYSASDVYVSLAPAINIQVPYNWERFLCMLSGMNTDMVKQYMLEHEKSNKAITPPDVLEKLAEFLKVVPVTDEDILATIRQCHDENDGYVICPHTAAALCAAYSSTEEVNKVVFGVASPLKFGDVVEKAKIGWNSETLLSDLEKKPQKYVDWESDEDWYQNVKKLVTEISELRAGV